MPGPTPKHGSVRARRNKTSTAAKLNVVHDVEAPELPPMEWHPQVLVWWADIWSSPMAPEYDESDRHGLFILAVLVDAFWTEPSQSLAAEIRLQRQCFGLTPMDRRRLQWEIERVDEAQDRGAKRRATKSAKPVLKASDPRSVLRAV